MNDIEQIKCTPLTSKLVVSFNFHFKENNETVCSIYAI